MAKVRFNILPSSKRPSNVWGIRHAPGEIWTRCNRNVAMWAVEQGYEAMAWPKCITDNAKMLKHSVWTKVSNSCRNFPGRTASKHRPNGKPEPGYKMPKRS